MAVLFPVWSPKGRLPAHPRAQGSRPSETPSSRTPTASCICSGSSRSGGAHHVLTMVKKLLSGSWRKPVLQSCTLSPAGVAGAPGDMLVCSPRSRGVWVCFSALLSLINGWGFRSEQVWEGFLRLPPHGLATTKDLAEGKSTAQPGDMVSARPCRGSPEDSPPALQGAPC